MAHGRVHKKDYIVYITCDNSYNSSNCIPAHVFYYKYNTTLYEYKY